MIAPLRAVISKEFAEDCKACFQTPAGERVLAELCKHRNPLEHCFLPDERTTEHVRGNQEVVALLWLHGTAGLIIQPPAPTTTHESNHHA